MANAYTINATLFNASEVFYGAWKLIRTQLAAGYRYKASGNGQSGGVKDTSGDTQFDLWGYAGGVHLSAVPAGGTGSGAGVSIGAGNATTGLSTITGVSGFTASSVGRYITITGSVNAENNQNFRITAQTGTTVTVYGPDMVAETGNASIALTEVYGGADGSITTYVGTGSPLINFTTGSFTGFTAADVGNKLTILNSGSGNNGTYTIAQFVANNNVLLYSQPNASETAPFITASDAGNPTLQWIVFDPRQQGYPLYISAANGQGAWYNIQGPTTLKIPIGSNVSTGTFIRGENITQTTTGAQGELLGYEPDASGGTGYLVVMPRLYGTGVQATGVRGWNASSNTDTITGALSGATVTTPANSVPIAYISEWVWWKNNATTGHCYHQRIDRNPSTEAATTATTGRFSAMATSGTVTSQVAPAASSGSNPTTNGFPTVGTYVVFGTATTGTVSSGQLNFTVAVATTPGKFHCLVANAMESSGVSADGSWRYLQSCASTGYQMVSYERMDNQEDGDLDPYIHVGAWGGALNGAPNRTALTSGAGSNTDNCNTSQAWINQAAANHGAQGFRRRGLANETYNYFSPALLYDFPNSTYVITVNAGNPDQVGTSVATTYVRETMWFYLTPFTAQLAAGRMRKGQPRWFSTMQGGTVNSTLDSLQWIVLSSTGAMFVAGPWDGATTPSF